jgi:1,4-dihydroxy-2-naphthoyl-CoA hydrolase
LGIDRTAFSAVGLEINCNHLRAKRDGMVRAIATPVHRGRRNWVWDIRVYDEADALIAISRCTLAVVPIG